MKTGRQINKRNERRKKRGERGEKELKEKEVNKEGVRKKYDVIETLSHPPQS